VTQIPLLAFLLVAAALFAIGLWTALRRTNAIQILMGIELMLNAVNLNLVAFARYTAPDAMRGLVFALFVLVVAAAEAAVGLAIIITVVRRRGVGDVNQVNLLRG
jgi:NAD(P)H-quinone oxidoreductase subunit 4L